MSRSSSWRINKSSVMAVEGAQALKALKKVAGAAGLPKDFKVHFATESVGAGIDLDDKEVTIGGGRLFTEAPIPADKFDILVGLTLHEVGHQQIATDQVWGRMIKKTYNMAPKEKQLLQQFVNVCEDIAIEAMLARNPNITDYADSLFNWATSQSKEAKENKLLELWIEYSLLHKTDKLFDLRPELVDPMTELVALTGWLRQDGNNDSSRAFVYGEYWNKVRDFFLTPSEPAKPPEPEPKDSLGEHEDGTNDNPEPEESKKSDDAWENWGNDDTNDKEESDGEDKVNDQENENTESDSSESEDGEEDEVEEESSDGTGNDSEDDDGELTAPLAEVDGDRLSDDLEEAIEAAMESNSEDITIQVLDEFAKLSVSLEHSQAIIRSRETQTKLVKPDQNLCKKLGRMLTIKKRLQARIMHGEQYGRIDKRHLARVSTDKRIFNLKYKFPDGFPNTRILIDLSGSMSGKEADEVLQAAGALQMLANAEVWGYHNDHSCVVLVRLDEGKLVHHYDPTGGTPSGLGIVGVSLGMKRGGLVIHLTDGEHNSGQMPWNANWVLKSKGIELVNLIWGNTTKHYDYDGMNWKKLKGLAEFPDALYGILIEQAKLGNIGG